MNPEQLLTRDTLSDGATTAKQENQVDHQLAILSEQLKRLIKNKRSSV